MASRIEIVPYDDRWPAEFAAIATPIREAMGDLASRIDHIGSTSVPGLAAKDVIDIQVTVESLDAGPVARALRPLGYALREGITEDHVPTAGDPAPAEWRKLYFHAPQGQRRTHLHVRQAGRLNQRYALLFRDCLRANPQTAAIYAHLKHVLARLHPDDIDAYYDVKDPVCDLVMDVAGRWAHATEYVPGPSDR